MNLKKIVNFFPFKNKADTEQQVPPTFKEELNRQCNALVFKASLLAIFSWLLFIPMDQDLYGNNPLILYLRVGFTLVGLISLLLHFTPFFKRQGYWLVILIVYYLEVATGWILGLVGGDPVYMGGYAIVILTMALVPIRRIHALLVLLISLVIFTLAGSHKGMEFVLARDIYGFFNLAISVLVALLAIFIVDNIRETGYENRRLLQRTNEKMQKANELKNQLLQVAAHDLKDPLQVIIGYTELLKENLKENKFANERLKIIYRSTDRMIKLIGGLLEISSIESGNLAVHKSEVDFGEVVDASVKSFLKESQRKNQQLQATIEKNCIIDGDRMLLRQVANHLISNAIKFSPPGKPIAVAVGQKGNVVALNVRDEGPGLDDDEIKRLYDKFQRLSPKPTAGEISTGLGLAITRELVELHQGTITVESLPGKGSTFIVNLPILNKEPGKNTSG